MWHAKFLANNEKKNLFGLLVVVVLYFALYGTFLVATHGVPYVFDNNETFSSIVHAENMLNYGIDETYGLTDESYGRTPESHPYVYTHQGNFPRLFALLIYLFGARSAEAQIAVTTFTIGIIGVVLAYDLIARRAGWAVGILYCSLMMTDYVMVAQWQVVTWRVWHMLFFFLSLWCVDRASRAPPRAWPWLAAITAVHAALFYFELIFAAFTAAAASILLLINLRRRLRWAVKLVLSQILGTLIGVGTLIGQLWAYLGWENFIADLRLTYLARNEALDSSSMSALTQFMSDHRIVFWFNINSQEGLRQPTILLEKFFSLTLGIYTPALVAIVTIITIGVLILRLSSTSAFLRISRLHFLSPGAGRTIIVGLFLAYALLVIIGVGWNSGRMEFFSMFPLIGVSLLIARRLSNDLEKKAVANAPLSAWAPAATTLLLSILWLSGTEPLYASPTLSWGDLDPIWSAIIASTGQFSVQLALLIAGWISTRISAGMMASAVHATIRKMGSLLTILASGLAAYTVVYLLSPGYVLSGYLERFVPFVTFVNLLVFAIGVGALIVVTYDDLNSLRHRPWWHAVMRSEKAGVRVRPMVNVASIDVAMILASIAAVIVIPSVWVTTQATYIKRIPADEYDFLTLLDKPPFKGASFVVNNYAAPVAVTTGQWAYYDPLFGYLRLKKVNGEPRLVRDLRYLWLADRNNPAYLTPEYFLCVMPQDMSTAFRPETRNLDGCTNLPLVRDAEETIPRLLSTTLVAHDESGRDRWAIVRLDWHRDGSDPMAKAISNRAAEEDRSHD